MRCTAHLPARFRPVAAPRPCPHSSGRAPHDAHRSQYSTPWGILTRVRCLFPVASTPIRMCAMATDTRTDTARPTGTVPPRRVVIVGGVAGGMSTATRLRRLDESAQIIVLERSGHVSYANCGLPYFVGGVIEDEDDLLLQTPEKLHERFRLDVRVDSEVVAIDAGRPPAHRPVHRRRDRPSSWRGTSWCSAPAPSPCDPPSRLRPGSVTPHRRGRRAPGPRRRLGAAHRRRHRGRVHRTGDRGEPAPRQESR